MQNFHSETQRLRGSHRPHSGFKEEHHSAGVPHAAGTKQNALNRGDIAEAEWEGFRQARQQSRAERIEEDLGRAERDRPAKLPGRNRVWSAVFVSLVFARIFFLW